MDVNAYLARINYTGSTEPTLETLRALQLAHLYAVPFENLDIHWGRPIILDYERLFDKIVTQRRGGFCYELNGMFGWLLTQLGYHVSMLNARVYNGEGHLGIEFDHMTLRVDLDEPYLVDVGFGDAFRQPLRLHDDEPQIETFGQYRIDVHGADWTYLAMADSGEWKPQYAFTLTPHALADFAGGCEHQQTSPDSGFTKRRVCTLATPDGRITVAGNADGMRLIRTTHIQRDEQPLADEGEFIAALHQHFAIDLPLREKTV